MDVPMGEGASCPSPMSSNVQESWSKFSHVAGELAKVFFVTFVLVKIVGQLVKHPPPNGKFLGTSLETMIIHVDVKFN